MARKSPREQAIVLAFMSRLFDSKLTEREHSIAIEQLQSVLPCKLFINGTPSEYEVLVFVDEGRFEALPTRLRSQASYIEEVRRDGSGIVYKTRTGKPGPIPKTTMPGYKRTEPRTAWARVLDD